MLLLLIPSIWLALAAFFVILCRGAGRADSFVEGGYIPAGAEAITVRRGALTVFESESARAARKPRMRWSERARARNARATRADSALDQDQTHSVDPVRS
jgi:hypothetical protein